MGTLKTNTVQKANGDPVDLTGQQGAKAGAFASYPSGVLTAGFSLNVSSLTDVAAGVIDFNFTTAFTDTSYNAVLGADDSNYGNRAAFQSASKTGSSSRTVFVEGNSTAVVDKNISTTFMGDLA
jgi:hypothetical protein